jgi:mycothiol system anti-sigma-R factor
MNKRDDNPVDDVGCLEVLEVMYAYIDGELDDPEYVRQIEHHMGHCRSCFSRKEMEMALTEHVRSADSTRAPDSLKRRMKKLMDSF